MSNEQWSMLAVALLVLGGLFSCIRGNDCERRGGEMIERERGFNSGTYLECSR